MLNQTPETGIIPSKQIRFILPKAPGDTVAMTAFIRDLKLYDPTLKIGVRATGCDQLLAYSPHLETDNTGAMDVQMDYGPGIECCKQWNTQIHYLEEFHRDFNRKFKVKVPLTEPRPDLHLTPRELETRPMADPYWVVVAGYKADMPTKAWSARRFQEVITRTTKRGYRWVQLGATPPGRNEHFHFPLDNTINLLRQTDLRQFMWYIFHSAGVLCGVTMAMLVAAAFWRPCVTIAAGRESWYWLSFSRDNPALAAHAEKILVSHRVLSTIGQLDCCRTKACNTKQLVPPHQLTPFPAGVYCARPAEEAGQTLPECMRLITTDAVITAIESYERNPDGHSDLEGKAGEYGADPQRAGLPGQPAVLPARTSPAFQCAGGGGRTTVAQHIGV